MKPPYVRIEARCERHGAFVVEKKPNRRVSEGRASTEFYQAVVCQKCRMWGEITRQELIEAPAAVEIEQPGLL